MLHVCEMPVVSGPARQRAHAADHQRAAMDVSNGPLTCQLQASDQRTVPAISGCSWAAALGHVAGGGQGVPGELDCMRLA